MTMTMTPGRGQSRLPISRTHKQSHLQLEIYLLAGDTCDMVDFIAEIARVSGAKVPRKLPAWVLKVYGRISVMIAAFTGKEPDVTPEIAVMATTKGVTFRSDKAIRELGYRIRSRSVSIRDNYDWLVKEGLLDAAG